MRRPPIPSLPSIAWRTGAALLLVDAAFLALYLAWKLGRVQNEAFNIGYDQGLAEIAQHAKMLWVGLCGGWLVWRTGEPVYKALSALFLGLFIDDAGRVHERAGVALAEALHLPAAAGLNPRDFGEILSLVLWVGPLCLIGVVAHRRSGRAARATAWWALGALVVLAGFGIGVDLLHQILTSAFPDVGGLHSLLTAVEEGGEMGVMSAIAAGALAVALAHCAGPADLPGDGQAGGLPVSRVTHAGVPPA